METNGQNSALSILSYLPTLVRLFIVSGLILWNLDALTWSEIVWIGFPYTTVFVRLPFSLRNQGNVVTVDHKTLQERALMGGMVLAMWVLPVIYVVTKGTSWDILAFANYSLPFVATLIGALLLPPYAYLFWKSHADLGRNWSPSLEMRERHTLVVNGIYKRVRHPMYAALWLIAIAQPLLIHNWIAGGMMFVAFSALYCLRVSKEEKMMLDEFGSEYRDYMARTGRIFPRFS